MCTVGSGTSPDVRGWKVGTPSQAACDAWCENAPDNPCALGAGGGGTDRLAAKTTDPIPPGKWLLVANYAIALVRPTTRALGANRACQLVSAGAGSMFILDRIL